MTPHSHTVRLAAVFSTAFSGTLALLLALTPGAVHAPGTGAPTPPAASFAYNARMDPANGNCTSVLGPEDLPGSCDEVAGIWVNTSAVTVVENNSDFPNGTRLVLVTLTQGANQFLEADIVQYADLLGETPRGWHYELVFSSDSDLAIEIWGSG